MARTFESRLNALVRNLVIYSGRQPADFATRVRAGEVEIANVWATRTYAIQAWVSRFNRDLVDGVFDAPRTNDSDSSASVPLYSIGTG